MPGEGGVAHPLLNHPLLVVPLHQPLVPAHTHTLRNSAADPDPGSGALMTPGSGMGRKSASGSGIRDEQPGSYFLELRNLFLGLKYLII